MKRIVLFVSAILMAMVSLADDEPKSISLTAEERELVNSNNDFAFNLFRTARTEQSQILSPLSITYALGMLNNGAAGETLKQINTVLGFGNAGAEGINAFCRKMLTEAPDLDEQTKVMIANNIYVNEGLGYVLQDEFVDKAKKYYDAEPESRDFDDGKTLDIINQWASDHTEGMIPKILKKNEFSPDVVSYLLNALYFKGTWTLKFDETETQYEEFGEGRYFLPMMHQEKELYYTDNDECQALTLPYGNGAYQMTILLPREGKTVNEVLQGLTAEKWQQDYQRMDLATVDVKLPRFESMTDIDLKEIMAKLGMPDAFDQQLADFPYFCNVPVYIFLMKQVAKIKVNEEGTEAAAVTVIGMDEKAAPQEPRHVNFHADRPFLYVISERSTGSIFFIGQFMGDTDMNPRGTISLTSEEKQLVKQNNDFALNLFRQARTEESQILSPLSITGALGMLNNGAAGKTQQEINDVLGFGDAGAEAINNFNRKMLFECPDLDAETKAMLSNTIFVNQPYQLQVDFTKKANYYYDARPESRDFHDGETMDVINQWASDHTEGMIPQVLDESTFDPNAVSYLLNAIYFKGTWANKFDKAETKDEEFLTYTEQAYPIVPMMHQYGEFVYTDNDTYQAIKLPYGNGAYQMTVFLPHIDKEIHDVLDQLDGENWRIQGRDYEVDLKLPRFETETQVSLNAIMSALGMPTAFTPSAEFPNFCDAGFFIGMMKQFAKIKLDEEGTEAAAVTIIEATSGIHETKTATFHANRPFLYIISEQSTGAIFFIGQYTGLSEEQTHDSILRPTASPSDSTEIYNLQGQRLSTPPAHGIYLRNGKKYIAD